jgi:hypothetical protein
MITPKYRSREISGFAVTNVEKNTRFFLGIRLPKLLEPRNYSSRLSHSNSRQLTLTEIERVALASLRCDSKRRSNLLKGNESELLDQIR